MTPNLLPLLKELLGNEVYNEHFTDPLSDPTGRSAMFLESSIIVRYFAMNKSAVPRHSGPIQRTTYTVS